MLLERFRYNNSVLRTDDAHSLSNLDFFHVVLTIAVSVLRAGRQDHKIYQVCKDGQIKRETVLATTVTMHSRQVTNSCNLTHQTNVADVIGTSRT